jgi:hypothetical protein
MAVPTTITDRDGRLVLAGQGRSISGKVLSVNATTGTCVLELDDAYLTVEASRIQITVPCYNLKEGRVLAS